MMRYLYIYRSGVAETDAPVSGESVKRMEALIHEMTMAGVLLAVEGCLSSMHGAKLSLHQGELKVVDGPFADVKQIISGVLLLQTKSKADAIEWGKRLLTHLGEGHLELRLLTNPVA